MPKIADKIKHIEFKPAVLVEKLADALTGAIVEGVFKGGDQLIETDLKEKFGISRSPIRESFRVLERKGLVEIIPRRGTFVKQISRKDIEEHFPVRSVLEGLAARQAYEKLSPADLKEMERVLAAMKLAAEKNDAKGYWRHHITFHEIFINASGNQLLCDIVHTLRMHMMWYRLSYRYYKEDFKKSYKIHEKILGMFKSEKTDLADLEQVVRHHIDEAVEIFKGYLGEQKEPQDKKALTSGK